LHLFSLWLINELLIYEENMMAIDYGLTQARINQNSVIQNAPNVDAEISAQFEAGLPPEFRAGEGTSGEGNPGNQGNEIATTYVRRNGRSGSGRRGMRG
jgi:hypothetical protein